eukprot:10101127-Alexandrium_andersonii.AAC.1
MQQADHGPEREIHAHAHAARYRRSPTICKLRVAAQHTSDARDRPARPRHADTAKQRGHQENEERIAEGCTAARFKRQVTRQEAGARHAAR